MYTKRSIKDNFYIPLYFPTTILSLSIIHFHILFIFVFLSWFLFVITL